jgi:hypothetical protein
MSERRPTFYGTVAHARFDARRVIISGDETPSQQIGSWLHDTTYRVLKTGFGFIGRKGWVSAYPQRRAGEPAHSRRLAGARSRTVLQAFGQAHNAVHIPVPERTLRSCDNVNERWLTRAAAGIQ